MLYSMYNNYTVFTVFIFYCLWIYDAYHCKGFFVVQSEEIIWKHILNSL